MKKLSAKKRRLKMTRWSQLTLAEKIAKVIISLLKVAAIVVIAVTVGGIVIAIVAGIAVAFGVACAIGDGFHNASKAYRPGDVYVNDRRLK